MNYGTGQVARLFNVVSEDTMDRWRLPAVLFAIILITRIPFTSQLLYDQDSVQFALALENYDVYLHQPHPPGYFLYIILGKLVNLFLQDPNSTFLLLSVIGSGLTVVVIYRLGTAVFDREAGVWAAAFAVASPLLWYYGEIALTYVVAAFFNVWVASLCWNVLNKRSRSLYFSAVVLAITGGIRQDVLIFLFPLWLFCILGCKWKQVLTAGFCLGIGVASWFIPMLIMAGGPRRYFLAIREYWSFHTSTFAVWNAGIGSRGHFILALLGNTSYGLGIGAIILMIGLYASIRSSAWRLIPRKKILFFSIWLGPAFLFHILVFMNPDQAGYSVFFLPALFFILWPTVKYLSTEFSRMVHWDNLGGSALCRAVMVFVITANALFFLCSDNIVSGKGIREHDRNLAVILGGIQKNFPPEETVIVDNKFYGLYNYRHVQYYLRKYHVYLTALSGEGRIVLGNGGQTRFVRRVPISPRVRYVVYLTNPFDRKYIASLETKGLRRLQLDKRNALLYQER